AAAPAPRIGHPRQIAAQVRDLFQVERTQLRETVGNGRRYWSRHGSPWRSCEFDTHMITQSCACALIAPQPVSAPRTRHHRPSPTPCRGHWSAWRRAHQSEAQWYHQRRNLTIWDQFHQVTACMVTVVPGTSPARCQAVTGLRALLGTRARQASTSSKTVQDECPARFIGGSPPTSETRSSPHLPPGSSRRTLLSSTASASEVSSAWFAPLARQERHERPNGPDLWQ